MPVTACLGYLIMTAFPYLVPSLPSGFGLYEYAEL